MLDEIELRQVRNYVIRILPQLFRQEPEIAMTIDGMIAQHFPRRDEFARMLDQLTAHRKETTEQFEQVKLQFKQVDEQFKKVDERFEKVDERFDQVDERFKEVDRNFVEVRQEIAELRDHMNHNFVEVRQEISDLREYVDDNFVEVRQEISDLRDEVVAHRKETNERFTKVDRNMLLMKRDIVKLQHSNQSILKRLDNQEVWLNLVTGNLWSQKGEQLEDMVAIALRYGLKNPTIQPESIRLRQKLVDSEGLVFKAGFITEVDLITEDDKVTVFTVFEVKARAKASDVGIFALKVELVAAQNPSKAVKGVLICLGASDEIRQLCAQYGLELLPSH